MCRLLRGRSPSLVGETSVSRIFLLLLLIRPSFFVLQVDPLLEEAIPSPQNTAAASRAREVSRGLPKPK